MSEIDTSQLLVQMRSMAAAAQGQGLAASASVGGLAGGVDATNGGAPGDFAALLQQSLGSVNELKQASGSITDAFIVGDSSVSLAEVMIAKQKSGIAFEATVQVRNKLLDAYKQVMAMQV